MSYLSYIKKFNLSSDQILYFRFILRKYSNYRRGDSKRFGTDLNYSVIDMANRIHHSSCIYCGHRNNLGLDRINNRKGHTLENTVVCCFQCNFVKTSIYTYENMREIGKVLRRIHKDNFNSCFLPNTPSGISLTHRITHPTPIDKALKKSWLLLADVDSILSKTRHL